MKYEYELRIGNNMKTILIIILFCFSSTLSFAENKKRVLIMGGDGFCGWPTTLYLSELGHEVGIVDNLSRRAIAKEIGAESLTPIASIEKRLATWHELTGKSIPFYQLDVAKNYDELVSVINTFQPEAIIHFAEQRAAPYSMKSTTTRRYTVDNNLNATNNILSAIIDSGLDVHLIHLGSMGVYGYGKGDEIIPEGYLTIPTKSGGERDILYPSDPGSIYHMTKCQDALLFYYYNKNDEIRITDLHQGIVWGTNTLQTLRHEALINRFDYDSDYGTVLNRFLIQAAIEHPLTVYGTGDQTRAFIHIRDMIQCISLALDHPPLKGERVKIFNQMTETHRLIDLAKKIQAVYGSEIIYLTNPRKEASSNNLSVSNRSFLDLNLRPITLSEGLLTEIIDVAKVYSNRIDLSKIPPLSLWESKKEKEIK